MPQTQHTATFEQSPHNPELNNSTAPLSSAESLVNELNKAYAQDQDSLPATQDIDASISLNFLEALITNALEKNQLASLLDDGIPAARMIAIVPHKKEEIQLQLIQHHPSYFLTICPDYKSLYNFVNSYPDKKEQIFSALLANSALMTHLVKNYYLPDSLVALKKIFGNIFYLRANELIAFYAKTHDETYKLLDPFICVPTQEGPRCAYYGLSAITSYFASLKQLESTKPTLFYPVKHNDIENYSGETLKKIAKKIGLSSLGGIFDLTEFQKLIDKTGLDSEILSIKTTEQFQHVVQFSLNYGLPLIFPYDAAPEANGNKAHYAVLTGYKINRGNEMEIFISQNNTIELVSAEKLFKRNHHLNYWLGKTFVKKKNDKNVDYDCAANDTHYDDSLYKIIVEPDHDISETLKHKLLIVFPTNKRVSLEVDDEFNKIKSYSDTQIEFTKRRRFE